MPLIPLPRPHSNVVPFPGSSRIAQNEARLAAARRILREPGHHDSFTLCMACNTLRTSTRTMRDNNIDDDVNSHKKIN